ncbi:UNVERIFIED_CONTAM: hypothetical protein Scaly_1094500 [Sesamum calycinum]|uniref:Uncharacterized protein n=2 Tax=Sesamum TaxID=4181 RepID=A0AAW2QMJ3_9LAMI
MVVRLMRVAAMVDEEVAVVKVVGNENRGQKGRGKVEAMVLGVLKGQPLVTKVAAVAKYGVLPGAMIAALVYSPPDYALSKKPSDSGASSLSR